MKVPVWMWLIVAGAMVACGATGYQAWRVRQQLEAEQRFSMEKVQSLLSEVTRLEENLAVARVARNPKLVSFVDGDRSLRVAEHNTLLLPGAALAVDTRLSATIFNEKGEAILTHPTLRVQKGNLVVYPLPEGSLKSGAHTIKLFRGANVVASFSFSAE